MEALDKTEKSVEEKVVKAVNSTRVKYIQTVYSL